MRWPSTWTSWSRRNGPSSRARRCAPCCAQSSRWRRSGSASSAPASPDPGALGAPRYTRAGGRTGPAGASRGRERSVGRLSAGSPAPLARIPRQECPMVTPAPPSLGPTPQPERLLALLRTMLRIRVFEETFERLFLEGSVPGFVHLYIGEEAIATGVCAALERDDFITSTHRGHGHAIAKGVGLDRIAAELLGKRTGVCRGKGGSMHVADFQLGILGANGIVGGGFGLATGAALSARLRGTRQVAVCFFGDGAANKGTFHEALNLAAVRRLPAVFVCENNGYAQFTSTRETLAVPDVAERAAAYDVPGVVVDGNDVLAVQDAAREAVARARRGDGPSLLEMKTYRQRGHYVGDPERYRGADEVQDWRARDPIPRFEQRLLDAGLATPDLLRALHAEAEAEMAGALRFAQDSPLPDPADALEDLFAPPSAWLPPDLPAAPPLREISAVEAERDALRLAMRHDPTVFALGLDIQWGGSFGQFAGLSDEFGPERVVAMPISEANMIATAVGAAITGCRPIVSMNFVDFTLGAMDELVNQAAKIRYMFGGQVRVPLVLRSSDGAVRSAAAQHSQSLEALFAHVPGLKIVTPSSPADVKPLLLAAIAD